MTQFCFTHLTPCESQPAFVCITFKLTVDFHLVLIEYILHILFDKNISFWNQSNNCDMNRAGTFGLAPHKKKTPHPENRLYISRHPESIVAHTVHFSFWFLSLTPSASYCLPLYLCLYPCRSLPLPFLFGQLEELDAFLECKQKLN